MRQAVEIGGYSAERDVNLVWTESGYEIEVSFSSGEVTIKGNAAGLTTLAQHLLTLAAPDVPEGTHWHFEPAMELEDASLSLVLSREPLT